MSYTNPEIETMGHASELVEVIFAPNPLDYEPSTQKQYYIDPEFASAE